MKELPMTRLEQKVAKEAKRALLGTPDQHIGCDESAPQSIGSVAAAILAAVEGGILPPGWSVASSGGSRTFQPVRTCGRPFPPGKMPRLYGRPEARRYSGCGMVVLRFCVR